MTEYLFDGRLHELSTPEPITGFLAEVLRHAVAHGPSESPHVPDARPVEGQTWLTWEGRRTELSMRVMLAPVLVPYEGKTNPQGGILYAAEGPYEGSVLVVDLGKGEDRVHLSAITTEVPYLMAYVFKA